MNLATPSSLSLASRSGVSTIRSPSQSPGTATSLKEEATSLLEFKARLEEEVGRTGEQSCEGNSSGVIGDAGEKRRCLFMFGGVLQADRDIVGRLQGDEFIT